METILSVENLGKSFKYKNVVNDVSFDVYKGEIMAVLGPNGAGKSTTIRSIMNIIYPDYGKITFKHSQQGEVPRHLIGYLPEERGLYKNVKVLDILLYLAELKDYPRKKARERALSYLKKYDLEGNENVSVDELSKGMSQKVQFISAIIHEPKLLILDEPFSGLDPVSQELFKEEIRNLAESGTAILLSSHQMNLVEEMCDRLFMMHRGKRVIYGDLNNVKTTYANFKCTIRGKNDKEDLQQLPSVERLEQQEDMTTIYLEKEINITKWLKNLPDHLSIQELSIDRISLHEIFIDIATGKDLIKEAGDVDASYI